MNIAIIKGTAVIEAAVFEEYETAQSFLDSGVWSDIGADSVAELPDGYGIGDNYVDGEWEKQPQPAPDIEILRTAKLAENSELCGQILETEFKSTVKGDGLQPYRMNDDDSKNLLGYQSMILFGLMQDPAGSSLPMFEWKNANQIKCAADWTWKQVLDLFQEYGAWKVLVLERQDDIKERIINAQTADEIEAVELDYRDLLIFGDG